MCIFFSELSRDAPSGCSVGLDDESNFFSWRICFEGPPDTFYEGGIFQASLKFPQDFPNSPPEMVFQQDMWHPNGKYIYIYIFIHFIYLFCFFIPFLFLLTV